MLSECRAVGKGYVELGVLGSWPADQRQDVEGQIWNPRRQDTTLNCFFIKSVRGCGSEVFTSSLDKFELAVSTFLCLSGEKINSDPFEALAVGRVIQFPVQSVAQRD